MNEKSKYSKILNLVSTYGMLRQCKANDKALKVYSQICDELIDIFIYNHK